jgi:hypothetical protein
LKFSVSSFENFQRGPWNSLQHSGGSLFNGQHFLTSLADWKLSDQLKSFERLETFNPTDGTKSSSVSWTSLDAFLSRLQFVVLPYWLPWFFLAPLTKLRVNSAYLEVMLGIKSLWMQVDRYLLCTPIIIMHKLTKGFTQLVPKRRASEANPGMN